jgi:tetratricopeptide (TPR) repeat protein
MRLLLIAPLLLLMAPTAGGSAANGASPTAATPGLATLHSMCGDDLIAPSVEHILPGFGAGGMAITAKPAAQAFFNNGMQLAHAFAHQAATGAFRESARLDPLCAMCLWGEAWSEGPTINFPIDAATQLKAARQVETAARVAVLGPKLEQDMIAALALRYQHGGGKGTGDLAFAQAMDAIARAHPDSDELATIAADAWMIPAALRENKDNLPRAIELLEAVLKRNPNFTPAIHFYIHATEMMGFPAKAETYADRLAALAPAASHLIHMPSHTYYWIGRYQDAADANVRAATLADDDARAARLSGEDSIWRLDYHAHNVQFGIGGALISGDGRDALALAAPMLANMRRHPPESSYGVMAAGTAYAAEGRFRDIDAVLAAPDPGAKLPMIRAYWHYARGEALARRGDVTGVRAEAAAIVMPPPPAKIDKPAKAARDMAEIAKLVLTGRAAMLDHQPDLAIRAYAKAAKIEESKIITYYADPPAWWYPVRRSLAAALFSAGRPADALVQADAALKRRPADPVTTMLRATILAKLGKTDAADHDRAIADRRWHGDQSAFDPTLI